MGISILEKSLQLLREEGFTADAAYPGQKYPLITQPVAAVHIENVDRANMEVTVEVNVICPGSMGGIAAETEALRAANALRWGGAACIQKGCSYDGMAQVYVVPVLATFTGIAYEDSFREGPGFQVYLNSTHLPFAVAFDAEQTRDCIPLHEMGESAPVAVSPGSWIWKIRLEELIPPGDQEIAVTAGEAQLRVMGTLVTETFSGCQWTSIRREHSRQGLRRIHTGLALKREEARIE